MWGFSKGCGVKDKAEVSSKRSVDYEHLAFEVGLASKGSFDYENMAFEEVFYGGKKTLCVWFTPKWSDL